MCKCNFVYTHKKVSFPVPVFMKLSNVQHHVQISCTKFHLNWTVNVESMDRILFMPLSKVWFLLHWFSWTHNHSTVLCGDNLYQISPKSVKNYGNYRYKFIDSLKWSTTVTESFFTQLMLIKKNMLCDFMLNYVCLVVDARSQKDKLFAVMWTFQSNHPQ